MKRWNAIDGLRGYLAWIVVLCHCAAVYDHHAGIMTRLTWAGLVCVFIFIIVSGFAITHLVLEKRERYLPYLTRRFFRIFPLFAASCLVGAVTLPLFASGLAVMIHH